MKRVWMVCAGLAIGTHALLLYAMQPGTLARPQPLGDEPSSVELSIVESAPQTSAPAEPLSEPEPVVSPAAPEPGPTPPEPPPEVTREPLPGPPTVTKPPRPRSPPETRKARSPAASRDAVVSDAPAPAISRGPTTRAQPRYRSNPKPNYPPEARRTGKQGVVLIAVEVTADGRAGSVRLSRSSGSQLLDAAALEAVRRWTFEPARTAGIPTASRVEVPVRFDLAR